MMKQNFTLLKIGSSCIIIIMLVSCSTSGPSGLFGKKTPHEQYGERLTTAGLNETALGRQWFQVAEQSLSQPLTVSLPYSETGYFAAERPSASGIRFEARQGQKLTISLTKKPADGFAVYMDFWQPATSTGNKPKLLASADTSDLSITHEIKNTGGYQLRIQPELLKGGAYTLSISIGPSLAFPVAPKAKSNIGSFWGAGRDAGARSHEGIDIFAPRRTPLVAAAGGTVSRVNENNLGGKVVWLRPEGRDYTLYYAHLDEQIAQPGQRVQPGDTIGLMGNTGNAISTSPHLHFGIYTSNGAVDPLPFVDPVIKNPAKITAATNLMETIARTAKPAKLYPAPTTTSAAAQTLEANTVLLVEASTAAWYKVRLPDGTRGFIPASLVDEAKEGRKFSPKTAIAITDAPEPGAPEKTNLSAGEAVSILGSFGNYYLVRKGAHDEGWIPR